MLERTLWMLLLGARIHMLCRIGFEESVAFLKGFRAQRLRNAVKTMFAKSWMGIEYVHHLNALNSAMHAHQQPSVARSLCLCVDPMRIFFVVDCCFKRWTADWNTYLQGGVSGVSMACSQNWFAECCWSLDWEHNSAGFSDCLQCFWQSRRFIDPEMVCTSSILLCARRPRLSRRLRLLWAWCHMRTSRWDSSPIGQSTQEMLCSPLSEAPGRMQIQFWMLWSEKDPLGNHSKIFSQEDTICSSFGLTIRPRPLNEQRCCKLKGNACSDSKDCCNGKCYEKEDEFGLRVGVGKYCIENTCQEQGKATTGSSCRTTADCCGAKKVT